MLVRSLVLSFSFLLLQWQTDKRTRVEFRVLPVPDDGRLGLGVVDDARQLHLLILLHFEARPGEDPGQLDLGRRH